MPDDPIEKGGGSAPDPESKLKDLFDRIEREESGAPLPPDLPGPSNDEIRAGINTSPIESQLNLDKPGPDEHIPDDDAFQTEEEKQLREFDERLKKARGGVMPEPPEWNYTRPQIPGKNKVEENNYFGAGVGISIAYTLVGLTLVGWGIGKLIDIKSGGTLGQAIGTLLGAVIGLAASIVTIIRAQNKPGQ